MFFLTWGFHSGLGGVWGAWIVFWAQATSSGDNGGWPHCKASLSISFYLFTHPAALPPPVLGGMEFASWSPRWHWRLWLAQPAITLLPWTIALGFWEPFHLISSKNNVFSSCLCPHGDWGEWETPSWAVRLRESGCGKVLHCPAGHVQGCVYRTCFSAFMVDRVEKTLWSNRLLKT